MTTRPLLLNGRPIAFRSGTDTVLESMLRAGVHPTGGGALCSVGDCGNCVVTVDGIAYTRACQVQARAGLRIESHEGPPPVSSPLTATTQPHPGASLQSSRAAVAIVGGGRSGCDAALQSGRRGRQTLVFERDARTAEVCRRKLAEQGMDGETSERPVVEVLTANVSGVYPGPAVLAVSAAFQTPGRIVRADVEEVVVATGSIELQPVCPGTDLVGILTPRAALRFAAAGVDLGDVLWIRYRDTGPTTEALSDGRTAPRAKNWRQVDGRPIRFEAGSTERRIGFAHIESPDGQVTTHTCDTVVVDLGNTPRNQLLRMAAEPAVHAVGSAAVAVGDLPPPPCSRVGGIVCPCGNVSVEDLEGVFERGFHDLELVKRATLAGTGTCQGRVCTPHLRAFLADRGAELQPAFTARPVDHPLTVGEAAAATWLRPSARTALHDQHVSAGAQLQRSGGWWRPWTYGDGEEEVDAVRNRVSLGDVSTLGKFLLSGPDAQPLLERVAPVSLTRLSSGNCRYALLLDERGAVLDDGMICRLDECDRLAGGAAFYLTLTSGGAAFAEMWLRDWMDSGPYDVRLLNQTESLGAINVTGPEAARLLVRAGARTLPSYATARTVEVAGVSCRVIRLSFTGELSYELHHEARFSEHLWRTLLDLGADLEIQPHGLVALQRLRLEKGHLLVGQDTSFDATPRRLRHEWAVTSSHSDFVGSDALDRTESIPVPRELVGLTLAAPAPTEGAVIWAEERGTASPTATANLDDYVGYVTSSATDHLGEKAVALGWVRSDAANGTLYVEGRAAEVTEPPFFDAAGARARCRVDLDALTAEEGRTAPSAVSAIETVTESFRRLSAVRISALPAALDLLEEGLRSLCRMRLADDELLLVETREGGQVNDLLDTLERGGWGVLLRENDPHALTVGETGFAGLWCERTTALRLLESLGGPHLPDTDAAAPPSFLQGPVAGIPAKLWQGQRGTLIAVAAPWASALQRRIDRGLAATQSPTDRKPER